MVTTEQIARAILKLPREEQERLLAEMTAALNKQKTTPGNTPATDPILALSGCVDLGKCLNPAPERGWLHSE